MQYQVFLHPKDGRIRRKVKEKRRNWTKKLF